MRQVDEDKTVPLWQAILGLLLVTTTFVFVMPFALLASAIAALWNTRSVPQLSPVTEQEHFHHRPVGLLR